MSASLNTAPGNEPVVVFDGESHEAAVIVLGVLEAAGIDAFMNNSGPDTYFGEAGDQVNTSRNQVLVSVSDVEAAKQLLQSQTLTETELISAVEQDPITLEEAERSVKHA